MSLKEKDIFQQALELIIDGVAQSRIEEGKVQAAVYLAGLAIADNKGRLDADKTKAILSLVEMAGEVGTSDVFS
ncbi:hypothetical protein L3Q72_20000 [Vibrio sp. JC009]|uniref:hypothetical protein n=1 Tax=Vibrio sp. JC009 TaxID=2912314 RepID=UPI0023AF74FA|nr:hypothetical protein [Vibrio sp. JC009]WED23526.1 hypothetical protein L3Q72_20000 [Vibrio sp. JC009]